MRPQTAVTKQNSSAPAKTGAKIASLEPAGGCDHNPPLRSSEEDRRSSLALSVLKALKAPPSSAVHEHLLVLKDSLGRCEQWANFDIA